MNALGFIVIRQNNILHGIKTVHCRSDKEMSLLTFLMYLNDDFHGGETEFPWQKIKPMRGSALIFPHRLSHQGAPVISGVKYVLRTDVMYRNPE